jgi:hypothetical protein
MSFASCFLWQLKSCRDKLDKSEEQAPIVKEILPVKEKKETLLILKKT